MIAILMILPTSLLLAAYFAAAGIRAIKEQNQREYNNQRDKMIGPIDEFKKNIEIELGRLRG